MENLNNNENEKISFKDMIFGFLKLGSPFIILLILYLLMMA